MRRLIAADMGLSGSLDGILEVFNQDRTLESRLFPRIRSTQSDKSLWSPREMASEKSEASA